MKNNITLALLLFLATIPTTWNLGYFDFRSLLAVFLLYGVLLWIFRSGQTLQIPFPDKNILYLVTIVIFSLFLFFSGGLYQLKGFSSNVLFFLPIFGFLILVTFEWIGVKHKTSFFVFFLVLAIILRFLMLYASPNPVVDLFTMFKESTLGFLQGNNPYDISYTEVYKGLSTRFNYWPLAFLAQVPFMALIPDPRILFIVSDVFCAWLLYILGRRSIIAMQLVIIYLFRPNSLLLTENAWTTPLEFLLLLCAVFCIISGSWVMKSIQRHREVLFGVFVALMTGIKPFWGVLILFAFPIFRKKAIRSLAMFTIVLSIIVGPFFLWNSQRFISETFIGNVDRQLKGHVEQLQDNYNGLNLDSLYYLFTGGDLSISIMILVIIATLHWVLHTLLYEKELRADYVVLGIIILFLTFCLLYKKSFINYYYLLANMIILWITLLHKQDKDFTLTTKSNSI